jgi:hypothetical protein
MMVHSTHAHIISTSTIAVCWSKEEIMKSPGKFVVMMLLALAIVQMVLGAAIGNRREVFPEAKAFGNSTSEPSSDDWEKAIGEWRNKTGSLVFELVDLNKADREYHPDEAIKVEGYVRKVPPNWRDKIHVGDLILISNKVEGNTLFGKWIQVAQKGDCPKLSYDFSSCSLKINTSGDTLTLEVESKQYWHPKCEWSDKVKLETFFYYRAK